MFCRSRPFTGLGSRTEGYQAESLEPTVKHVRKKSGPLVMSLLYWYLRTHFLCLLPPKWSSSCLGPLRMTPQQVQPYLASEGVPGVLSVSWSMRHSCPPITEVVWAPSSSPTGAKTWQLGKKFELAKDLYCQKILKPGIYK